LPASWTRIWANQTSIGSYTGVDPHFSGTTSGVQIGQDIYADTSVSGQRNHYGFLLGFAHASGDASGFALGAPAVQAGQDAIDAATIGFYWTLIGANGWYADSVVMGSALSIKPSSNDGINASTHGRSVAGSIEAGLPFAWPGLMGLCIEPQAQLIWQHLGINDFNDGVSTVAFDTPNSFAARLGVRASKQIEGWGATWEPFARVSVWRYIGGASQLTFAGTTTVPADTSATLGRVDAGVVVKVTTRGSVFANVNYAMNLNGARRSSLGGDAGMRWRW